MPKRIISLFLTILCGHFAVAGNYPPQVQAALKKSGTNRLELENAILYFKKVNDPLKLKAVYFLIANMDIHSTEDYNWVDAKGNKIAYNELAYLDYNSAQKALNTLKQKFPGMRPQAFKTADLETIKSAYLINNINDAFKAWRTHASSKLSFDKFCEYILPYRICNEPIQDWRNMYASRFVGLSDLIKKKNLLDGLYFLAENYQGSFVSTFAVEQRNEPLPRLGSMQLLMRKRGACEDVADLEVFIMRSQGLPASVDFIPYWATSSGSHFLNSTFDQNQKPISLDVYKTGLINVPLQREPAKVLRLTYSKQPNALASKVPVSNIPGNFLRLKNYIDVTDAYWRTQNVTAGLFSTPIKQPVAYICAFNYLHWNPTWWGAVKSNTVTFTNMCKGAVYLPAYYKDNKIIPASYPIALGYNHTVVLKPDASHVRAITLVQQENYLMYKLGKSYALYYWDNTWKMISRQSATYGTTSLTYNQVPDNALLLLKASDSQQKERPFIITSDDKRVWF